VNLISRSARSRLVTASVWSALIGLTQFTGGAAAGPDPVDAARDGAMEPPQAIVRSGDTAPDFSYESEGGAPLRLHDLLVHGAVLLVFEPDGEQIRALERERGSLLSRNVLPVAVLDRSSRSSWSLARRLAIHFTVIPDDRQVIAEQFNLLGRSTHRTVPGWFIVDRHGVIRGLDRGEVPEDGFLRLAAGALALPAPGATMGTSTGPR
jgi:peroxiredoxin